MRSWTPSSMEKTCLKHLDSPGSWEWLKAQTPEETDRITLWHVRRVFPFNFALFSGVLGVIFAGVAVASGYHVSDFRDDLPVGIASTVVIASVMAFFVTDLYRRSWNRRARYLSQPDED